MVVAVTVQFKFHKMANNIFHQKLLIVLISSLFSLRSIISFTTSFDDNIFANSSDTIILQPANFSKIKIKFAFTPEQQKFFNNPFQFAQSASLFVPFSKNDDKLESNVINEIIENKLKNLKEFISLEQFKFNSNSTTNLSNISSILHQQQPQINEIMLINQFNMPIQMPEFKLNISIDTVKISGLNQFQISDIASNKKTRKISALLRMPNIKLTMFYKVNGLTFNMADNQLKRLRTYQDKGRLEFNVFGWRTVFAAKIISISQDDHLHLSGFAMRSHYNYYDSQMISFINDDQTHSSIKSIDVSKLIANNLMKKVINQVDDKFETIMLEHLGVHEIASWGYEPFDNYFSSSKEEDTDDDGQMLMMESQINQKQSQKSSSRRRSKRQVPCEPGEELDEYVDSLFRFLKRLVRVMEPFALPNATIELEEYNLQIFLHSGGATRAYTFERKKPAWVLCQNDTISLGLTVGIEDARIYYKYRVIQDWRLMFDGDLEAQIRRSKAQIQITQLSPPESESDEFDLDGDTFGDGNGGTSEEEEEPQVQQRVDKLKVWKPGQITVLIRGLGNFSSALSMIINQMLSDTSMFDPLIRMIETDGVVLANDMLRNVSIPIFSII